MSYPNPYEYGYHTEQLFHGPHMACGCLLSADHSGDADECLREASWEHAMDVAEIRFENEQLGENYPIPSFAHEMAKRALWLRIHAAEVYLHRYPQPQIVTTGLDF